ncbi:MAG: MerR family transcriptional regulator [Aggregatilineales bacterium]
MMTQETTYTIRQITEKTGLSAYTLRYYEDIGLLDPVSRAENGHRRYDEADMRRINMLQKLRLTGMSLDDIRHIIELYRQGSDTASTRRELMEAHREKVQAQINELCEVLEFINYKVALYSEEEKTNDERKRNDHELSPVGQNGSAGL